MSTHQISRLIVVIPFVIDVLNIGTKSLKPKRVHYVANMWNLEKCMWNAIHVRMYFQKLRALNEPM
jgi:hypothetical protein